MKKRMTKKGFKKVMRQDKGDKGWAGWRGRGRGESGVGDQLAEVWNVCNKAIIKQLIDNVYIVWVCYMDTVYKPAPDRWVIIPRSHYSRSVYTGKPAQRTLRVVSTSQLHYNNEACRNLTRTPNPSFSSPPSLSPPFTPPSFLPRDAMQARPMSSCGVCLYLHQSWTV